MPATNHQPSGAFATSPGNWAHFDALPRAQKKLLWSACGKFSLPASLRDRKSITLQMLRRAIARQRVAYLTNYWAAGHPDLPKAQAELQRLTATNKPSLAALGF